VPATLDLATDAVLTMIDACYVLSNATAAVSYGAIDDAMNVDDVAETVIDPMRIDGDGDDAASHRRSTILAY
jgi:hypothetical protein